MSRRTATGQVAAVYRQSTRELGVLAEPFQMLSPAPDLLAATWAVMREAQLTGVAPRTAKEAVATVVSQINRCPYCAEAHAIFTHAAGDRRLAADLAKDRVPADSHVADLIAWARASRTPGAPELAEPPFPPDLAPEYIGTLLLYHFINRLVSVLLGERVMPGGPALSAIGRRVAALVFAPATRRRLLPGTSLALLIEQSMERIPGWAGDSPAGPAFAAIQAAANRGGELLSEPARAAVQEEIAEWDGGHPGLDTHWLDAAMARVRAEERPGAKLALMAGLAPYRIRDEDVASWRAIHPGDAELVRLLAYGAQLAVEWVQTTITAGSKA